MHYQLNDNVEVYNYPLEILIGILIIFNIISFEERRILVNEGFIIHYGLKTIWRTINANGCQKIHSLAHFCGSSIKRNNKILFLFFISKCFSAPYFLGNPASNVRCFYTIFPPVSDFICILSTLYEAIFAFVYQSYIFKSALIICCCPTDAGTLPSCLAILPVLCAARD